MATPHSGVVIAHYEIVRSIGAGGMGEVFLARDQDLDRDVALKFLPTTLCRDDDLRTRFTREAKAAAGLGHPNIVTIHEVGEHEGRPFIVMEHVDGQTLDELVREGPLPVDRAVEIARQVCEGLGKAHDRGIVHRDIKASNIIVDADGRARILDFGVAVLPGSERVTMTGSKVGTLAYMSPEQADGQPVDARSDLFSLGIVLYELLTGRNPFERAGLAATVRAICDETPEAVSRFNPAVPEGLQRIVGHLLEKDRDDRYQSTADLAADLAAVAANASPTMAAPTRRRSWRAVAAVLVVAAIGTVVAFMVSRAEPTAREAPKVVVIPFESLGSPEHAIVAAAISEEINSLLERLDGIRVISRTSARKYLNTPMTVQEISDELLGVEYVLEGTLTGDPAGGGAGRVMVRPRLIRVHDESIVWSDEFDREIDDIFSLRSDIARQVMVALDVTLLSPESIIGASPPTSNVDAYRAYIRGRDAIDNPDPELVEYRLEAVQHFERAVQFDDDFAAAWAELSWVHSDIYRWGHDRTESRLEQAESAAERALAIDPDLPVGHVARGYYLQCRRDYERALEEYAIAERAMPRNVRVMMSIATVWALQGRYDEAAVKLELAQELSPLDAFLQHEIGEVLLPPRKYEKAERFYNRSLLLAPEQMLAYACQAENYWLQGKLVDARSIIGRMPLQEDTRCIMYSFRVQMYAGDYQKALEYANAIPEVIVEGPVAYHVRHMYQAAAQEQLGETTQARTSFEAALPLLEDALQDRPGDDRIRAAIARCYAGLGRKEDAIREAERAVELVPIDLDRYVGSRRRANLAEICVVVGEHERAVDEILFLLSVPSYLTPAIIRNDPMWRPVRDHPRIQAVLAGDGTAVPAQPGT
jgi:TolB-like protein/Tfp pilus assembly protein PilF/predicted Ser/Thr protein kinase